MTWTSGETEIVAARGSYEADCDRPLTKQGSFGILHSWSCKLRKERVPHDPRRECSGAAVQSHEAGPRDGQRLGSLPAVRDLANVVLSVASTLFGLWRCWAVAAAESTPALGTA